MFKQLRLPIFLNKKNNILIFIMIFTFIVHTWNFWYPKEYVFDEVYHAFTAKEYLKGNIAAWEWWTKPPPGVAYEWTHPPLAKEIMAGSMYILRSDDSWAWRLPGVILGVLNVYLVYLIAKQLFKQEGIALLSGFLYSLDGLSFVQSRTGMNDIYLVAFSLLSLLLLLKKKFWLSAIFLGLALSSKWSALYLLAFEIILSFYLIGFKRRLLNILWFILIPPIIYLITYLPFFYQSPSLNKVHSFNQFIDVKALIHCQLWNTDDQKVAGYTCKYPFGLQNQMLYYHSHLNAKHDYASPWWSWPLNLYPVWYFVNYHQNGYISNIFASGNPILYWVGFTTIILLIFEYIKKRTFALFFVILGFAIFWLPWAFSPRIMFLYHFTPSIPFLCMGLSYQLAEFWKEKNNRVFIVILIASTIISFILIYPFLVGIPLPKEIVQLFFDTNATKNPFSN